MKITTIFEKLELIRKDIKEIDIKLSNLHSNESSHLIRIKDLTNPDIKTSKLAAIFDKTTCPFNEKNAPTGSTARCTDGCAVEGECPYSALKIYHRDRTWLHHFDLPEDKTKHGEVIMDYLKNSNYGRCVYRMENDQPDHYVTSILFADDVTASFSMEAFTSYHGRRTRVMGSMGDIVGDMNKFEFTDFRTGEKTVWEQTSDSHGGGDWNLASAMVIEGKAGMQMMGDWAKGEFLKAGKVPGTDFVCIRFPGTQGAVTFNSDQFAMFGVEGEGAVAAQGAMASAIMNPTFQSAFNVVKGSVPARTDVPNDAFDDCGKKGMADLAEANSSGKLFGSMAHGHAAPASVKNATYDVITAAFNGEYADGAAAAAALAEAVAAAQ